MGVMYYHINEASQFGQRLRGVLDPFSETLIHIQSAFEIIQEMSQMRITTCVLLASQQQCLFFS